MKTLRLIQQILIGVSLLISLHANANEAAKVQIYISPQDYTSQVRLWQYYNDYWFAQGPLLAPIAQKALNTQFAEAAICQANNTGNVLIWLRPATFYSPMLNVYSATITADTFSSDGKVIARFVAESAVEGPLDQRAEAHINQAYQQAMANLSAQLNANASFKTAIESAPTSNAAGCSTTPMLANQLPAYSPLKDRFFKKFHPVN